MTIWKCSWLYALFIKSFIVFAFVPQKLHDVRLTAGNPPQWRGPGLYRIINYGYQAALSVNESSMGTAIVSMPLVDGDNTQIWLIAGLDNEEHEWMIFNQASGAILSAAQSTKPARGVVAPPYEKTAHWTMDFATFENIEGGPAVISNVGIRGVLDLSRTGKTARTPILVYPKNNPVTRNQAWYLEYMTEIDMPLHASKALHACQGLIDGYNKEMDSATSETEHDDL